MNRPSPVKNDNFFVQLFDALRRRRISLGLRIASHSLLLVALTLIIYAWVVGMQFKHAMQQQADAIGQSLLIQTSHSASDLLAANDLLSLNVLLANLARNPLVAHVAVYNVGGDGRVLAEAGNRNSLLNQGDVGLYSSNITFQEVIAGHLRLSLNMQQFEQPMTISLQSMGILSAILLALTLALSMRLGRHISTPLLQLRLWLRDPDDPAPGSLRQDEIGDLARQLQNRLVPPRPAEATVETHEQIPEFIEPVLDDFEQDEIPTLAAQTEALPDDELSAEVFSELQDDELLSELEEPLQVPVQQSSPSAVLAIQLGAQEQLRHLPRSRLLTLLESYRHCIEQSAKLYQAELHTLKDGSSLMLLHQSHAGDDYLTHALCCGELMRALGHALQIEVADSGITLQLQLGLCVGEGLHQLSEAELLLHEQAQSALALSQHSRNLLLVEKTAAEDPSLANRARLRRINAPEGAYCVERLLDPYPSLLERQLNKIQAPHAEH